MVIYKIECLHNGKVYIGSTINYRKRKNAHINGLKKNKHHNKILQNYFNKYGVEDLVFTIIETVESHDMLIDREEYYINEYDSYNKGINLKEYFQRKQSFTLSKESKDKISKSLKGKKKTKEHIENMSKSMGGKPKLGLRNLRRTPKQKENIRNGVINSDKQKQSWINSRKKIEQYTLDGEIVKVWDSIAEAVKHYNAPNIQKVLKGKTKKSAGYFWKYLDKLIELNQKS